MNVPLASGSSIRPSQSVVQRNGYTYITGYQPVSFADGLGVWPLNPTHNTGRLATEARLYSRWKCTKLKIHYVPSSSATETGYVTIGTLDYDVSPANLDDHLVNSNGGIRTTVWMPSTTTISTAFYCDKWRNCFGDISEETAPTVILARTATSVTPQLLVEYHYALVNRVTDTANYPTYSCSAITTNFDSEAYTSVDEGGSGRQCLRDTRMTATGKNVMQLLADVNFATNCAMTNPDNDTNTEVTVTNFGRAGEFIVNTLGSFAAGFVKNRKMNLIGRNTTVLSVAGNALALLYSYLG